MEWTTVAAGLFAAGWSFIGIYVATTLSGLRESVESLNIHMGSMAEKVSGHDRRIERLEDLRDGA